MVVEFSELSVVHVCFVGKGRIEEVFALEG